MVEDQIDTTCGYNHTVLKSPNIIYSVIDCNKAIKAL